MALDLNSLLKEAQKMQKKMQEAQSQLTQLEVTGEAGAGLVKIVMNGRHEAKKAQISKTLFDEEDPEMLEDLICAAFNDAARKVETASQKEIQKLASQLPKDMKGVPKDDTEE